MKSIVERRQFINHIEQILHVPGNYSGGILEMTLVVDCSLAKKFVLSETGEYFGFLKQHSPVFANVRLNVVFWQNDTTIRNEVTSITMLQIGRPFAEMPFDDSVKNPVVLLEYLKKFHARSKLILVLGQTGAYADKRTVVIDAFQGEDRQRAQDALQPFLHRKILFL